MAGPIMKSPLLMPLLSVSRPGSSGSFPTMPWGKDEEVEEEEEEEEEGKEEGR